MNALHTVLEQMRIQNSVLLFHCKEKLFTLISFTRCWIKE